MIEICFSSFQRLEIPRPGTGFLCLVKCSVHGDGDNAVSCGGRRKREKVSKVIL